MLEFASIALVEDCWANDERDVVYDTRAVSSPLASIACQGKLV